jgi:hypothetical protein
VRTCACRLACVSLLAMLVAPAGVAQDSVQVIDSFESADAWEARPSDGVSVKLSLEPGVRGRALRVDFDFQGGSGYAVIRREVDLTLPEHYEFRWSMRAAAPRNHFEFKLADESGDNVWWSNQRDFVYPRGWTPIVRKKRHITYAWGPLGGGEIRRVAAIEFAITAGEGGRGTVWFDEMTLVTLPPPPATFPAPLARSSMVLKGSEAAHAIDGDSATSWRGAAGAALTLDLNLQREFGGLAIAWDTTAVPTAAIVATSRDARSWSTIRTLRGNRRTWTPIRMPEHEARYVRITLPQGGGVAELSIQPLEWAARENDLLRHLAAREGRGAYPRVWSNEASYWTVIGLDRDSAEALINTDGAIEVGSGAFSLEPFLTVGEQSYDWSNVTSTATLAPGALPLPRVQWEAEGVRLSIEAFAVRIEDASCLVATYRVANRSGRAAPVTLRLGLRPMQVNAPWQFLQVEGGFAPIRTLRLTTAGARVNDAYQVYTVGSADRVGAGAFDAGSVRSLPTSRNPASVSDEEGLASGVLVWTTRLAAGGTRQFAITAPMHAGPRPEPRCRLNTMAQVAAARARTVAWWREALSTFEVSLPASANPLVETLRASLAWILINRDGAALQPGSRSYERSWIRDGALTSTALLRLGHAAAVKDFILWYAPFQFASGKIPCCIDRQGAGPVPEHDSHGQFVYLVAEYYRHTGDTALVRRVWPHVTRAIAYQDSLRRTRRTALYEAADSVHLFGILPPSISHEGYSAKPAYSYWDNFFALRGYKDAATLALVLRDPLASRYAQLRDEFAGDLRASINAAMRRHGIPFIPGAADLGDFDPTSTTIALSPVGAEALLPRAAAESTFARYWRESVARERGTREWENYTPYELRSVGALVRLGKPREAHELLQFFFGHQRPQGFRHWAEVVWRDLSTPRFIGDMPHTWVASDFVRSALDFFGYEQEADSSFVVGAGVLPAWLEGEGLRVRGVRTHYGTLALTMVRRGAVVEADVRGLRTPPGGVVLRPPVGRRFTSVAGDGRLLNDGSIRLLALPVRIRASLSAGESLSPGREGAPARLDDVAIKEGAGFRRALERFVIHMDDAEPSRVPQAPLEVVEQRPGEVTTHIGTGLHRRAYGGDVGAVVIDAQDVVDSTVDRPGGIIERGAVFGHVERDVSIVRLDPQQHFGEGVGIDLPAGLGIGAIGLAHVRDAEGARVRVMPHHAARVVVHADEIEGLPDQRVIIGRKGRPGMTKDVLHLGGARPENRRIEELPVHVGVGSLGGGVVGGAVARRVFGLEVDHESGLSGAGCTQCLHPRSVRAHDVVRRDRRLEEVAVARGEDPVQVPAVRHDPRLVDRRPHRHPVAECAAHDVGVVGEPAGDVAIEPAAAVVEGCGEIPVIEGRVRGDAACEERVDQSRVEVESLVVDGASARGDDAGPGDAEAVGVEAKGRHELDVGCIAPVVVAGDVAGLAGDRQPGRMREPVPDARACAVGQRRSFDLIGGRRGAPQKVRGEKAGFTHVSGGAN